LKFFFSPTLFLDKTHIRIDTYLKEKQQTLYRNHTYKYMCDNAAERFKTIFHK